MRIALVYPPTSDPTAPYLAVPMLTGFLRAHGVDVLPIDANVEAWDALLDEAPMLALRARLEGRLAKNPSFWVKNVDIVRAYQRIDGVVLPISLESAAQLRMFGSATLRMTYSYMEVDGRTAASTTAAGR